MGFCPFYPSVQFPLARKSSHCWPSWGADGETKAKSVGSAKDGYTVLSVFKGKMRQYMIKFSFYASGRASEYLFGLDIYKESVTNFHLCHYNHIRSPLDYTIKYN